jgi:hypothetical protein
MPDHGILIALPQVPFVSLTTNACLPTADVVDSVIFDGGTLRAALMARRFFQRPSSDL